MSATRTATVSPAVNEWGHGVGLCSGQMEPVYELLAPFDSMPEYVTGRTVWTKEELEKDTSRWIHPFSSEEVEEIETAIRRIEKDGIPLAGVDQSTFVLSETFVAKLNIVRDELINGIGFTVLRGLPVGSWTTRQVSIAYLGIGSYIGRRVSQNRHGHVLGHIMDLSEGKEINGEGRLYRTHEAQTYHSDDCDIVGLICLHQAMEGGQSQVVSTHHIYNMLRKERPDVLRTICKAHWFYDRKGEKSDDQEDVMRTPGYYFYKNKLSMKWDSYYIGHLERFWDVGALPSYTAEQHEALELMEAYCHKLSLEMTLQPGDVQFVTNTHNLHARSAYKDAADESKKRWLQRLWLATGETEGGWPLPFADSKYVKRGGVQVNQTMETYPLEAE